MSVEPAMSAELAMTAELLMIDENSTIPITAVLKDGEVPIADPARIEEINAAKLKFIPTYFFVLRRNILRFLCLYHFGKANNI